MTELVTASTTCGVLFPSIQALTDSVYSSEFTDASPSDSDVKFGILSDTIRDLDLAWLIKKEKEKDPTVEIATDPRVRTHLYLVEVEKVVEQQCINPGDELYASRDYLHEHFPGNEFIGTPLSYTDVAIVKHPDGFALSRLGGGYAGNRMPMLASSNATPLLSGIEGWFRPGWKQGETLAKLPLQKLVGAIAQAGAIAGYGQQDELHRSLSAMTIPAIKEGFDNYSYITRYQDKALPDRAEHSDANAKLEMRLSSLSARNQQIHFEYILGREGQIKIYTYTRHPQSEIDADGNATYVVRGDALDPQDKADTIGLRFSLRSKAPIHEINSSTNTRLQEAINFLQSQVF